MPGLCGKSQGGLDAMTKPKEVWVHPQRRDGVFSTEVDGAKARVLWPEEALPPKGKGVPFRYGHVYLFDANTKIIFHGGKSRVPVTPGAVEFLREE